MIDADGRGKNNVKQEKVLEPAGDNTYENIYRKLRKIKLLISLHQLSRQ